MDFLGGLAGGIAHDINNVLVGIIGNTELALERCDGNPGIQNNLRDILQCSQRAAEMCREMLIYSGKGRRRVEEIDLSLLIEKVCESLEVPEGIELRRDLRTGGVKIDGDKEQLCILITCLLENAIQAMSGRGGRSKYGKIIVQTYHCELKSGEDGHFIGGENPEDGPYICMKVSDEGVGIDASLSEKVFDPYFTTRTNARGMGLAKVLGITKGHGGALRAEGRLGQGARFELFFPRSRSSEKAEKEGGTSTLDWTASCFSPSGHRVMVVDDEKTVRAVDQELLEETGYTVVVAEHGYAALELLKEDPEAYSCVLLDFCMPGMNGLEVLEAFRELRPDLPVVFSSGFVDEQTLENLRHHKGVEFLPKPYTRDALLSTLEGTIATPTSS